MCEGVCSYLGAPFVPFLGFLGLFQRLQVLVDALPIDLAALFRIEMTRREDKMR